jgi:hypothetical protein
MMSLSGRLILVKTVLSAIAIYHMLSLDIPPWVLNRINKICRAFLWYGPDDTKGGNCLVAWEQVLNAALRMRWRWLERDDLVCSWSGLHFVLFVEAEKMFQAACKCFMGNVQKTLF